MFPQQTTWYISIHALREEGDPFGLPVPCCFGISIHALREEGDSSNGLLNVGGQAISIHALREEGDDKSWFDSNRPHKKK